MDGAVDRTPYPLSLRDKRYLFVFFRKSQTLPEHVCAACGPAESRGDARRIRHGRGVPGWHFVTVFKQRPVQRMQNYPICHSSRIPTTPIVLLSISSQIYWFLAYVPEVTSSSGSDWEITLYCYSFEQADTVHPADANWFCEFQP